MLLCCLRRSLPPSATGASSSRSDASTSGSAVSPAACMILCVRFVWVVRRYVYPSQSRNTRYGWLAKPYPIKTFTLSETPSLTWRANAKLTGAKGWRERSDRNPFASEFSAGLYFYMCLSHTNFFTLNFDFIFVCFVSLFSVCLNRVPQVNQLFCCMFPKLAYFLKNVMFELIFSR